VPEFLRDQIWQFIGALVTFVGIPVTVALALVLRKRKQLSYEILSHVPLLNVEEAIQGRVKILFDGQPVGNVQLVEVKIKNSGNVPVLRTDYERPISLHFGDGSTILSAEVSERDPDNLGASVRADEGRVNLNPVLLNAGDWATIKVLVSQVTKHVQIDGRVIGVRRLLDERGHVSWLDAMVFICMGLWLLGTLSGAILTAFDVPISKAVLRVALISFGLASILACVSIVSGRISSRAKFRKKAH